MFNDRRQSVRPYFWPLLLMTALVALGVRAAVADEVTSKGTVLRGTITAISAAGITFEPEYGKGALAMKWQDITDLKSDGPFQVLYAEDQELDAPLRGFSDGKLLMGTSTATATEIDTATIVSGTPIGAAGLSFADQMRNTWRYWHGNFDLGFNLQKATTDTKGFLIALKTLRSKGPSRFTLAANYRYATETQHGKDSTVTQDLGYGLVREEYDLTARLYAFGSGDATYDGVQKLSIRGVPKAGLGYIIWEEQLDETTRNFLQAEAGGSWVYERYFGGMDRDYFAVAFGALAGYYLPYGAHFDWRVDYLPSVSDFTSEYLLRSDAGLTLPLYAALAAKFSLLDEYNNRPAEGSKHNSLYLTFGLSLVW